MTPRELATELRGRINPEYAAQIGTESYERRLCAEALEAQADALERLTQPVGLEPYMTTDHFDGSQTSLYSGPQVARLRHERDQATKDASDFAMKWTEAEQERDTLQASLAEEQRKVEKLREALQAMHDEKCDYMRRNNLGDPLRETIATKLVLPALASTEKEN